MQKAPAMSIQPKGVMIRISRETVVAALLILPGLISLAYSIYIGTGAARGAEVAILVRANAALTSGVLLTFFAYLFLAVPAGRPLRYASSFSRYYAVLSLAAITYFGLTLLVSLGVNSVYYAVGDAFRAMLPFISLFVLFSLFPGDLKFPKAYVDFFVLYVILTTVLAATVKGYFLLQGKFYGGGILQFSIPTFLLAYLLLRLLEGSYKWRRAILVALLLLVGVALSVLSMKRGNWVILAFATLATVGVSSKRWIGGLAVSLAVLALFVLAQQSGLWEGIVGRFAYTFSGSRGIDDSTFERLAEGAGTLWTLSQTQSPLALFTGFGHGAEFMAHPEWPISPGHAPRVPGYYHNIHSVYVLLFFRYGLQGLVFFALLIAPAGVVAMKFFKRGFRKHALANRYGQLCIAALLDLVAQLILGIKGTVLYGSQATTLFVIVGAYLLVAADYGIRRSNEAHREHVLGGSPVGLPAR